MRIENPKLHSSFYTQRLEIEKTSKTKEKIFDVDSEGNIKIIEATNKIRTEALGNVAKAMATYLEKYKQGSQRYNLAPMGTQQHDLATIGTILQNNVTVLNAKIREWNDKADRKYGTGLWAKLLDKIFGIKIKEITLADYNITAESIKKAKEAEIKRLTGEINSNLSDFEAFCTNKDFKIITHVPDGGLAREIHANLVVSDLGFSAQDLLRIGTKDSTAVALKCFKTLLDRLPPQPPQHWLFPRALEFIPVQWYVNNLTDSEKINFREKLKLALQATPDNSRQIQKFLDKLPKN